MNHHDPIALSDRVYAVCHSNEAQGAAQCTSFLVSVSPGPSPEDHMNTLKLKKHAVRCLKCFPQVFWRLAEILWNLMNVPLIPCTTAAPFLALRDLVFVHWPHLRQVWVWPGDLVNHPGGVQQDDTGRQRINMETTETTCYGKADSRYSSLVLPASSPCWILSALYFGLGFLFSFGNFRNCLWDGENHSPISANRPDRLWCYPCTTLVDGKGWDRMLMASVCISDDMIEI